MNERQASARPRTGRFRRPSTKSWWAAVVAAGVVTAATPATALAAAPGTPPVPALRWQACDSGFECATARVPLDYRDPSGQAIDIAMIRHRATDTAHRVGSLFFNPGGPGGAGTLALPPMYGQFPPQVQARFDIVSFDPRGIPASTGLRCFPSNEAEAEFLSQAPAAFPVGAGEEAVAERVYARFDAVCARRGGALLPHLSTANVARDMDLMRQAVGDRSLNYLGVSYGTFLGATYANLFPGKVRAMVLDGNVDPVAWTRPRGGLSTFLRLGSDTASAATLKAFLDRCASVSPARCAFSAGSPAATRAKLTTLFERLREQPVTIGSPPRTFTYATTVATIVDHLYTTDATAVAPGWQAGAALLQQLWDATTAGHVPAEAPARTRRAFPPLAAAASSDDETYNGYEQGLGVACSESPNPRDPKAHRALAALATARSGDVGRKWAWLAEPCASWPATDPDRYTGPWNRPTAHPILVIGTTGDPATPYEGSVAMSRDLADARLLTVDGYGHTELLNKSACADAGETNYLLTGVLAPAGTVCRPDHEPFATP